MTFMDISLLREELRLLKSLRRNGPRKLTEQEQACARALLVRFHFIQPENDGYKITKEGRRYLNFLREDAFRHRWPVYLAISSFVLSLISLLVSLLS